MTHRRLIQLAFCGTFCLLGCGGLLGCSGSGEPQRHALRGSVVVEGNAVAQGTISFLPSPGNSAQPAHTSIEGGKYRFNRDNGPYSGAHRVVIGIKTTPEDEPTAAAGGEGATGQGIKEVADPRRRSRLPSTPVPTKLQWEVEYTVPEEGDDQKDFDLRG